MPIVNIQIVNDDPLEEPISDVVISIYDMAASFQTGATSSEDGLASVVLPDGDYLAYFYKAGVIFNPSQPQTLVVSGPDANTFKIIGHIREEPESDDPLLCTVSGKILGANGKKTKSRLIFEPVKELLVLDGNVIAPQRSIQISSDSEGYFEFELLRNTKYNAYFLFPQDLFGQQPGKLDAVTPDLPRVDLHSLLFPIPLNTTFSESEISLVSGSGEDSSIIVSTSFSDGTVRNVVSTAWAVIEIVNSDPTVADVCISGNKLLITPLSAGTITITTQREIPSKVLIDPLPDYSSDTITVIVT